jgi:hypothetical protein
MASSCGATSNSASRKRTTGTQGGLEGDKYIQVQIVEFGVEHVVADEFFVEHHSVVLAVFVIHVIHEPLLALLLLLLA